MGTVSTILIACLPSAVTAFCFWLIEQRIAKHDKKRDADEQNRIAEAEKREKIREKEQTLLVRSVSAAIVLGTATAKAVERIPDTHCNGDMHAALEYADKIKREQDDFLTQQGIENIYEEG